MNNFKKIHELVDKKYVRTFWFIIGIAFLLRLAISFFSGLPWYSVDSYSYLQMADGIVNGEPLSRFPNGLPLLLSGLKSLLPETWIPLSIIWINVLVSTAVVGLAMGISKKLTQNNLIALIVGVILAAYPNQLNYVRQILTEAPTTFLLLLQVYLFFHRKYFLAGAFLVIAVLFRSSLLPLIPFMLVCVFVIERSSNQSQILKYTEGIISVCLIFIFLVFFDVVKPSDNLSANLLISIKSYGGNIDYTLSGFTTAEMDTPLKTYLTFIKEQPLEYLKQRLLSFNELWGWPSTGEPPRSIVKKLLIALRIPLLIGSVTAFYLNLKKIEVWILFFPILTITAIHTLFFSTTRFSYVVEPFAIILAVIAIVDLLKNPPQRKKTITSAV